MTPEKKRDSAIEVFREIRSEPDQALEDILTPPNIDQNAVDNLTTKIQRLTQEKYKAWRNPDRKRYLEEQIKILEKRKEAYQIELRKNNRWRRKCVSGRLFAQQSKAEQEKVEENRRQEINEREAALRDYTRQRYMPDVKRENEEYTRLYKRLQSNFSGPYTKLHDNEQKYSTRHYENPKQLHMRAERNWASKGNPRHSPPDLEPFTGPDMTEYELVTPIHVTETVLNRLRTELKVCKEKEGENSARYKILYDREYAYSIPYWFELRVYDKQRPAGELDLGVLERNYKQEIEERRARIRDYTDKKYGKGTQKAKDEYEFLCRTMEAKFDIARAKLYNKMFKGWRYRPKRGSLAAVEAYRKQRIKEAGFREGNYRDDSIKCEENKDAVLDVFAATEKKFKLSSFPFQENFKFYADPKTGYMSTYTNTDQPKMIYNAGKLADFEEDPNAAIGGFPDAGTSAHHESFHRLMDITGEYINRLMGFEYPNQFVPKVCRFLEDLMSEDLDREIRNLTHHTPKANGRQKRGYEHHGVDPYATTLPCERLAVLYEGLATKAPKDWTVAERALSNILRGGPIRYANKVAKFLKTPVGNAYMEKYRAFREVFPALVKEFSPEILQNFDYQDWTKDLEGDTQSLLKNNIVRMIEKNHDLDIIRSKLRRLDISQQYLVALQKDPKYQTLIQHEMDYLEGNKDLEPGSRIPSMHGADLSQEYFALENLFSKIKKYVKTLPPRSTNINVNSLIGYIKQRQNKQSAEAATAEKKWQEEKTKFLPTEAGSQVSRQMS